MPLGLSLGLRLFLRGEFLMGIRDEGPTGIAAFLERSRSAVHVRRVDGVLMIRPDKTLRLNESAAEILAALYRSSGDDLDPLFRELAGRLGTTPERIQEDARNLLEAVEAIFREDFSPRPALRMAPYEDGAIAYPTLAEIAVTYGCQNRCIFCYASSPRRGEGERPMSPDELRLVMDKIWHQGHVPSLSFTGGEATLRPDLPELVRYAAELGFRVNLISNGIRLADPDYAARLVDHGLASAQISLEASNSRLHDEITGRPGSFEATVGGVETMRRLGIHVHTNTTLCTRNLHDAPDLVRFLARTLGQRTMSMNMVIPTGEALVGGEDPGVSYRRVAELLPELIETAASEGIRLVWYSPMPYCIFNPVIHGLGAKSCACVHGILSVDPRGEVLPCSSFERGLGSLLREDFETIYRRSSALYWRKREYLPPLCRSCPDADVCAGACPLYWDAQDSFAELPVPGADDPRLHASWREDRHRGGAFGVAARKEAQRNG